MVERSSSLMISSSRFEIKGRFGVRYLFAPQNTRIDNGHVLGCYGERWEIDEGLWSVMPHVKLANLPSRNPEGKWITTPDPGLQTDPKSVEQFVRTYGGFRAAYVDDEGDEIFWKEGDCDGIFDQDIAEVAKRQQTLRQAWLCPAGPERHGLMADDVQTSRVQDIVGWSFWRDHLFNVDMFPGGQCDEISLRTNDLWSLIGYLLVRDVVAKRIGVCANPDCPAPYYLKNRRNQQFCQSGSGSCTAYAQRQYALKWWQKNEQGKQAKKRGKSPRKKRQ